MHMRIYFLYYFKSEEAYKYHSNELKNIILSTFFFNVKGDYNVLNYKFFFFRYIAGFISIPFKIYKMHIYINNMRTILGTIKLQRNKTFYMYLFRYSKI